jgi:hypothetical protein
MRIANFTKTLLLEQGFWCSPYVKIESEAIPPFSGKPIYE